MNEIVKCKDCKYGHFFVPCKEAKVNHDLLKYQCNKIKGRHNPNFYCGYAVRKNGSENGAGMSA